MNTQPTPTIDEISVLMTLLTPRELLTALLRTRREAKKRNVCVPELDALIKRIRTR